MKSLRSHFGFNNQNLKSVSEWPYLKTLSSTKAWFTPQVPIDKETSTTIAICPTENLLSSYPPPCKYLPVNPFHSVLDTRPHTYSAIKNPFTHEKLLLSKGSTKMINQSLPELPERAKKNIKNQRLLLCKLTLSTIT